MKFQETTARELREVDRERTLVVAPIAAVEQHGPHMPTGTDHILCGGITEAVESRRPDRVLLLPTFWLGASSHHLRFGATLDAALDTYVDVLCDIGRSILSDGFRRLLFVNGHGGNVDPMRVALRRMQPGRTDRLLAGGSYWSIAAEFIGETLDGDHKFVGHACELETSLMLHLRPELVHHDRLRDAGELVTDNVEGVFLSRDMRQRTREGFTGRPDLATPEKGERLFEGIVERLVAVVDRLLDEPLATEYVDFLDD